MAAWANCSAPCRSTEKPTPQSARCWTSSDEPSGLMEDEYMRSPLTAIWPSTMPSYTPWWESVSSMERMVASSLLDISTFISVLPMARTLASLRPRTLALVFMVWTSSSMVAWSTWCSRMTGMRVPPTKSMPNFMWLTDTLSSASSTSRTMPASFMCDSFHMSENAPKNMSAAMRSRPAKSG